MSVYQYAKDYFTNIREPFNAIIVGNPSSIRQRAIMKNRSKISLDKTKQPNHCQPGGSIDAGFEANRDLVELITKTVEDILNRKMTKMESDISWLLQNAKS